MGGTRVKCGLRRVLAVLLCVCTSLSCAGPTAAAAEPNTAGIDSTASLLSQEHAHSGSRGTVPLSLVEDGKVEAEYFTFHVTEASGESRDFSTLVDLTAKGGYTLEADSDRWDGVESGEQTAAAYPQIHNYVFKDITVDGMAIYGLGIAQVGGAQYVYISAQEDGETGPLTSIVLPEGHKIQVNYGPQEFPITYAVYADGQKKDADDSTFGLNAVFGIRRAERTSSQSYSVDVVIPAGYTGRVYMGDTSDFPGAGLGTIPEAGISTLEKFPQDSGYGPFPLGMDVQWEKTDSGAKVKTGSGIAPGYFSLSGTYTSGDPGTAQAPQTCCVILTKNDVSDYKFSASEWLQSGAVDRGEGIPRIEYSDTNTTVNTDGSVNFSWRFTTSIIYNSVYMELRSLSINEVNLNIPYIDTPNETGSATAETKLPSGATVKITVSPNASNTSRRDYRVEILNARRDMVVTAGSVNSVDPNYRELVVSRIYGVDLQVWYVEADTKDPYAWIDLNQSNSLRVGQRITGPGSNPFNFDYAQCGTSSDKTMTGNVRFRLQVGYGWAGGDVYRASSTGERNVQFKEKTGKFDQTFGKTSGTRIYGPDAEGWYYTKLDDPAGAIGLLTIQAEPVQYMVRYQDGLNSGVALNQHIENIRSGQKTVENMPAFLAGVDDETTTENHTDTNRGSFYSEASSSSYSSSLGSDRVTTYGNPPAAAIHWGGYTRPAAFRGWVVTDAAGRAYEWDGSSFVRNAQGRLKTTEDQSKYRIIMPAATVPLNTLAAAAQIFNEADQDYIIYFTALWDTPTPPFSYYITFNYTDAGGEENRYTQSGLDPDTPDDDVYLTKGGTQCAAVAQRDTFFDPGDTGAAVVFDRDRNRTAQTWLESHPWSKYDPAKNGSDGYQNQFFWDGILDSGEVDVWFTTSLGRLTVSNEVIGLDDDFTFDVTFKLPAVNDVETAGDETVFFGGSGGPYSVAYTGSGGKKDGVIALTYDAGSGTYSGTFTLRSRQSIVLDLPAGTSCTVTEEEIKGYSTGITSEEDGTHTEWRDSWIGDIKKPAAPGVVVAFQNTGTGVTVEKRVHHMHCVPTTGSVEAAGGDELAYSILVKNTGTTEIAGPVTVRDHLKLTEEALGVSPTVIDQGGYWNADTRTITWDLPQGMPAASSTELTFGAALPIVEESIVFENHATVTYGGSQTATSNTVRVTAHPYWLRIVKAVTGGGGDRTKDFTFQIDLTAPEGQTLADECYMVRSDTSRHTVKIEKKLEDTSTGVVTIQLHDGESALLYTLAKDTGYSVSETDNYGYDMRVTQGSLTGKISNARDEVVITNFKGAPDLVLTKRVNGAGTLEAEIGEELTYTITIANRGDAAAGEVTVTDRIPAGLELVEGSVIGGSSMDRTVTWNLDALGVGEEKTFSFHVKVPNAMETTRWSSVASAVTGGETYTSDEVAVIFTAQPALSVTKTPVSPTPQGGYRTGDIITWRITATNSGNVDIPCPIYVADELTGDKETFIALDGLKRGESASQDVDYVVTDADRRTGQVTNTAFVSTTRARAVDAAAESTVTELAPMPSSSSSSGVDQWLDAKHHGAYLHGYPDGRFGPEDTMTRAEAAQMFYNLLLDKNVTDSTRFTDVQENSWYAPAVQALSSMGIIRGYGDGRFGPGDTLTRAQLVAMAMRFSRGEAGTCDFTDVPETHWAYQDIAGAVRYGWVEGYGDGTFGPDDPLTRAQATAIVNRMLDRTADMEYISKNLGSLKTYPDLSSKHWAYGDIMEASNGHRYIIRSDAEKWREE